MVGGLLVGGGLVAQFINERAEGGFEQYVPMIGAIGLILTAILNPEGIAPANAELGKGLWRQIRGGRAAPVAEPAACASGRLRQEVVTDGAARDRTT